MVKCDLWTGDSNDITYTLSLNDTESTTTKIIIILDTKIEPKLEKSEIKTDDPNITIKNFIRKDDKVYELEIMGQQSDEYINIIIEREGYSFQKTGIRINYRPTVIIISNNDIKNNWRISPVRGKDPVESFWTDQFIASITWYDDSGNELNGKFKADTVYVAEIIITPKWNYSIQNL